MLLRGEKIIIATGSSPVRPGLFPFGQGEIYDSDTILKLDRIPKALAVVVLHQPHTLDRRVAIDCSIGGSGANATDSQGHVWL